MTNVTQTTKTKRIAHSVILLAIVGIASSFAFVLTALASGIVPAEVITLANSARLKAGLTELTENAKLSAAARNKANDMIKNDYFAHTSPTGVDPWHWMKQSGYQYKAAGENLAINYTDAKGQHDAWMKSATHRANIMNERYQEIGVAVVKGKIDGKESIVTVEFFGTPLHAVVDQVSAAPPLALPAPAAIKGVETLPQVPIMELSPAAPAPVLPAPVPIVMPVVTPVASNDAELTRGIYAALVLVVISLMLAPSALIFRAFRMMASNKRETVSTSTSVEIAIMTPLDIDSIHRQVGSTVR